MGMRVVYPLAEKTLQRKSALGFYLILQFQICMQVEANDKR